MSMAWDEIKTAVFMAISIIGVIIFLVEMRKNNVLKNRELGFSEKKFEHEKLIWREQERHVSRQLARLDNLIEPIAARLRDHLTTDTEWLTLALKRSELFPYEGTIFGERSNHFLEEKNSIARVFSPFLLRHIEELLKTRERVCIFIDSGTTLFPFFDVIGQMALEERAKDSKPKWISGIEVVSNNLPGIVRLMTQHRAGREEVSATPSISCTLLGGQPLKAYAAVTGPDTEASVKRIVDDRSSRFKQCYFISIVTGNWIRLRRTPPVCPVPLARGAGHLDFKQAIMHLADEVYVVAPLGKIFASAELAEINNILDLKDDAADLDRSAYKEIATDHSHLPVGVDKVRLVTTVRTNSDSILRSHSVMVGERFKVDAAPNVHNVRLGDKSDRKPILIPFDLEQTDVEEQKQIEFPHVGTRRPAFFRHFQILDKRSASS